MPKRIELQLPVNFKQFSESQALLFKDFYIHEDQPVLHLNNCFVTFNGIVLSKLQFVRECNYELEEFKDRYYKRALQQAVLSFITRWGRKNKLKFTDKQTYSIVHQPFINYFHWIIESLTRMVLLERETEKSIILIPRNLYEIPYIKDSLELFAPSQFKIIDADRLLFVKNLALPSLVRWWGNHDPDVILELRSRLLHNFRLLGIKSESPERIFAVRMGRRKIKNFDEISAVLKQYNFSIIDFEGMSFYEQIGIMSNVKVFIAQHGAGLTNMLFMPIGGTIVEIHIDPDRVGMIDLPYYNMASALHHSYFGLFSDVADEKGNFFHSDSIAPVNKLQEILEQLSN